MGGTIRRSASTGNILRSVNNLPTDDCGEPATPCDECDPPISSVSLAIGTGVDGSHVNWPTWIGEFVGCCGNFQNEDPAIAGQPDPNRTFDLADGPVGCAFTQDFPQPGHMAEYDSGDICANSGIIERWETKFRVTITLSGGTAAVEVKAMFHRTIQITEPDDIDFVIFSATVPFTCGDIIPTFANDISDDGCFAGGRGFLSLT